MKAAELQEVVPNKDSLLGEEDASKRNLIAFVSILATWERREGDCPTCASGKPRETRHAIR